MLKFVFIPCSWILNHFPVRLKLALGYCLGSFVYYFVPFRRSIVIQNLSHAFASEKSAKEIREIARRNYVHYALVLLEWIESFLWTAGDFRKKTDLFWEPVQNQMELEQGGILLTSHLGNWEFAIQSASAHGMPCDIIVKRQQNQRVQQFLTWFRTRFGASVIFESGTIKNIFESLAKHRFVVFVLDQFMGPPIGLPVKFFGQEAGTAAGLALITEKSKNLLFTAYSYRGDNGKIQVHIEKLDEPAETADTREARLYEKTQWYNDIIEKQVRKHPEQWLWLHKRWKPFQGQSRWQFKPALLMFFFGLFLVNCSSQKTTATPTGIDIPADPTISIPLYGQEDSTEKRPKKPLPKAPLPKKIIKPVFSIVPVDKVPFEVGERMVIDLTWLSLPAGKGVLEVREGPQIQGRPTYHLWGNVLSSKMVDTIYHVDNTIESFIDRLGFIPYKFLLSMFETAQKKETRVVFDHPNERALYWSKRISQKWGDQDIDRSDFMPAQSRDMFSALYYARALEYELNKKQTFSIYENGQNFSVELLPIAREIVTSGAGVFQCWKIKVDVKLNNVLRPTGDLFMWLSDDSKKYLVRFDAKVKIGSLLGRLVSLREHE
ncbi:MAG: DUF3108 domain-containing protein [Pseudomonadota bacterium]